MVLTPKVHLASQQEQRSTSSYARTLTKGRHHTVACKDTALANTDNHRTFHLYTPSRASYVLKELEGFPVRDDSVLRQNGKPIWPTDPEETTEVMVADYIHLMREGKAKGPLTRGGVVNSEDGGKPRGHKTAEGLVHRKYVEKGTATSPEARRRAVHGKS
jgi:hypothetical protein